MNDGAEDETPSGRSVVDLSWVAPELSGVFDGEVRVPPQIVIDGVEVAEVVWELSEPSRGTTRFVVRLGDEAANVLNRVAAVCFTFQNGEASLPTFPYHLNALKALASGQGRTDLLKQAGDFDLGDEELEELLVQLEEVLVVDSKSIWRMRKRRVPEASDDESMLSMAYDELDWDAIQSHPKLAQYRNWEQGSSSDPTPLGILLTSIAEQFESDVQQGRTGDLEPSGPESASGPLDDLAKAFEAEDEETAEEEEDAQERRRMTARSRARRHFHSFIQRFVNSLTDEEFVRNVGPSVIVPSYVIFNHLCWKLVQIDLADPRRIIDAQTTLWGFFWGNEEASGYLETQSVGEQEAALDIFDRLHSEAVFLCSLFQAYKYFGREEANTVVKVRDAWRTVLLHPLWQPTRSAIDDSATLLKPECESAYDLIEDLDSLASYVSEREPFTIIGHAVGSKPERIAIKSGRVNRGPLGAQDVSIYAIEDPHASVTPDSARKAISALTSLRPEVNYIRLEDRSHDIIAFADYQLKQSIFANRETGYVDELTLQVAVTPLWKTSLKILHDMIAT